MLKDLGVVLAVVSSYKDKAIEEAGALYEGGSMQSMVENSTASSYTRDRCYYLLGILRQLES